MEKGTNMNSRPPQQSEDGKEDPVDRIIYIFHIGTVGVSGTVGWVCIDCDASLKDINLGQLWKGIPKYQTKNDNGNPTGNGSAFEDVVYRKMKQTGHTVEKVKECKDGADFIVDGKPCQLKFGSSPKAVFKKLFENGKPRYKGQVIITNKENEEGLRKLVAENAGKFGGDVPAVNPSEFVTCDRRETYDQYKRGLTSLQLDLKDILLDSASMKRLGLYMTLSGFIVMASECYWEYLRNTKAQYGGAFKISKYEILKKSCLDGVKKSWRWALLASVAGGVGSLGHSLAHRQVLRVES